MLISVIIPVHNEEKNITAVVNEVNEFLFSHKLKGEIIVVNDRSTDDTKKILDAISKKIRNLRVINRNGNPNDVEVGYATRDGINVAKYNMIAVMMGDLSDDPNDIFEMMKKLEEGYDIVCGSRLIKGSKIANYPKLKLFMMRSYNMIFSFLFNLPVKDFSNAFKIYKKKVFKDIKIESKEFEVTAEIILKSHIAGYKIAEVPVKWVNRKKGESKLGSFDLSFKFLFKQLPRIGIRYCLLALKLYIKYISKNLF